jgi:hypothetical protein
MKLIRMRWISVIISLLIVASGLVASCALTRVDQDLRVIYAEYTLAAIDLGRVNGELIRYRTAVIRATEADAPQDYERIAASLPQKRARIDAALERFVNASNGASSAGTMDAHELTELKVVREKWEAYIATSEHTIQLLEQRWQTGSLVEAQRLRNQAERNTANDAGNKFIDVTSELERLVEMVAGIAGEVKKEADSTLRVATIALVGVSLALATVVLAIPD